MRYLAENTDGLDVIIVERPGTLRPVEVLGAAWLDAVRPVPLGVACQW